MTITADSRTGAAVEAADDQAAQNGAAQSAVGNNSAQDWAAQDAAYDERLRLLSEGSVNKNFQPYRDIAWDSPEFAVVPGDERWILQSETDPMGGHPWYQAQSKERRIAIGMWRQAN